MCQYRVYMYNCSHASARELTARCESALAQGVCSEGIQDAIYTVAEPCPACMTDELLGSLDGYSASEGERPSALQADITTGAEGGPSRSGTNVHTPSSSLALKSGMAVPGAHSRGSNGMYSLQSTDRASIPHIDVAKAKRTVPAPTPRRRMADKAPRYPPELVLRSQPGIPMPTNESREVPVLPPSVLSPNITSADRTAALANAFGPPHVCHPVDRQCNAVYGPCPAAVNLRSRPVEGHPGRTSRTERPVQAEEEPLVETRTGRHRQAEEEPVRTSRTEREGTARLQIADSVLRARRPERQGQYSINEVVDSTTSLWEQKKRDLDEEEN